ncbi:hypothetical protein TPSD3_06900 [Thioflexithrix psekupsensis]|uniref:Uncharacterized protein n=1 Tax=Thioflexithrix psekupsensis TaxID=1570016 RepID=A0A251X7Z6_9GAMM|nr:hypothetical protein TPSD3_06900 [Thioflexithrix psekupsensis]
MLEKLILPIFLLCLLFCLTTVFSHLTQDANWNRFLAINWHRIVELLDLREENTIATWFSSIVFFLTALSFVLLGWGHAPHYHPHSQQRLIFKLAALATCLLSADEVGSLHETAGSWADRSLTLLQDTPIYGMGYPWLLLSPIIVLVFAFIVFNLFQITALVNQVQETVKIRALLWAAIVILPSVFVFEFMEAYLGYLRQKNTFFPVIEELLEVMGMFCLYMANILIARYYRL